MITLKKQWKTLLISILIPLAVGGLSGYVTKDAAAQFQSMVQPPLAPPAWLFPVVWTILFILMGIASFLVWKAPHATPEAKAAALRIYGIQLAVNFFWSILFFNFGLYFAAFGWLLLLWGLILITFLRFREISPAAGLLLLPYLLWVTFAGYLNLAIALLN